MESALRVIEHVLKESAEWILRGARRQALGEVPEDLLVTLKRVRQSGYAVIERYWPVERCAVAVEAIDRALLGVTGCHRWDDPEGSDHRLYCAERIVGEPEQFHRDPLIEAYRRAYSGVSQADKLLLAARLDYVTGNKGSGGGWHRDSPHRSQFKAILYLSDVAPENGPFEYIEGSHLVSESLRMVRDGRTQPNQYRFSEDEIARIVSCGAFPRTFAASAGTLLLVDTKGIHRGRPIETGTRYALTQYCFDGKRPDGFLP